MHECGRETGDKTRAAWPAKLLQIIASLMLYLIPPQFSYATVFDWILMIVGTLVAIAHGVAFPGAMLVFGEITNAFVNHEATNTLANDRSIPIPITFNDTNIECNANFRGFYGDDIDCDLPFDTSSEFFTCSVNLSSELLASIVFDLESVLRQTVSNRSDCLNNDDFISEIDFNIYIFLGIAGGAFLAGFIQVWLYQLAAKRQTHTIRLRYFRAILYQDIGWFDVNRSGELTSRLSE